MLSHLVVAGVIRREQRILSVRQQSPDDLEPGWSIPGGVVKPGELVDQALEREVFEETGVRITDPGPLLYALHQDDQAEGVQVVTFVFEGRSWSGELRVRDPDSLILEAAFLHVDELAARMARTTSPSMHEPLIAHLRQQPEPGAVWLYRRSEAGVESLVRRLP